MTSWFYLRGTQNVRQVKGGLVHTKLFQPNCQKLQKNQTGGVSTSGSATGGVITYNLGEAPVRLSGKGVILIEGLLIL